MFDVLLLSDWISDELLRLVFDILLLVFGNQMIYSFSCLINQVLLSVCISDETLLLVFDI